MKTVTNRRANFALMTSPILLEVHCERCGVFFTLPELPIEKQRRVAELIRMNMFIEAIRFLRFGRHIELVDAKSIVHHVTRKFGVCHRCHKALPATGQVVCQECKSLNFDW
jgi:hypothetical protein